MKLQTHIPHEYMCKNKQITSIPNPVTYKKLYTIKYNLLWEWKIGFTSESQLILCTIENKGLKLHVHPQNADKASDKAQNFLMIKPLRKIRNRNLYQPAKPTAKVILAGETLSFSP